MAFWNRRPAWAFSDDAPAEARSTLANPDNELLDALAGLPVASGERVTVDRALGLGPVWSAVSLISEQIGQLPLKVYREIDDEKTEVPGTQRWRLLHDKPNEHTPAGRFWATLANHLLLWGNGFILKRRPDGIIVDELWLLPPASITVGFDPDRGIKAFDYQVPNSFQKRRYSSDEVLHIFGNSIDGIVGMSPIAEVRNTFGLGLAREQFESEFYGNGARLSGVIQHPRKLSQIGTDHLSQTFNAGHARRGRRHGVPVLEEGATFQSTGSPLKDLEFVAAQQLTRTDIANIFKLPPNYLGGSTGDSLTYATVESNQIHFALHAISPWTKTISQALTLDPGILPQSIFSCEFILDGMLRADSKTRGEVYSMALDPVKGWMNREEVRRRENLSPADDKPAEPSAPSTPPADLRIDVPGSPSQSFMPVLNGNGAGR